MKQEILLPRKYYEQLYDHKLDKLDEMDKFLERQKLPKLTKKEIGSLNRYITSQKIGLVIKIFPQRRARPR